MSHQTLPVKNNSFEYQRFPTPEGWEEKEQPEILQQPKTNFDFSNVSKMGLALLTSCNDALNDLFSFFSVSLFKISAEGSQQPQQKSVSLLSNMLSFFKSFSGSSPQTKSAGATTSQETSKSAIR